MAGEFEPPRPTVMTGMEAMLERYVRHIAIERGLSKNTVAAYQRDLANYLAFLASRGITEASGIEQSDVSSFADELGGRESSRSEGGRSESGSRKDGEGRNELSSSSIARMLSSVRTFHRFLLEEGAVTADVSADTKPPKLSSRLPKAISVDQVASVIAAAEGDDIQSLRDRALLELLYATGARISELVALNVDDVLSTGDDGVDVVRLFGKGSKQRIVPFGRYARAAIDAYLIRARPTLSVKGKPTPALFLGMRGARVSRQNAWLIVKARAEQAGLGTAISPHTFRHSFATHLLSGGADVRVVQELLGHSSVATTQIYTLVTADSLRDMYTTAHPRAR